MARKRIYRCLNETECAEITARNPGVDFRAGLTGAWVDHQVYMRTMWDANIDDFPKKYLDLYQGRMGNIIVSADLNAGRLFGKDAVCRDNEMLGRDWYVAFRTGIIRVKVEEVIEVVPLED